MTVPDRQQAPQRHVTPPLPATCMHQNPTSFGSGARSSARQCTIVRLQRMVSTNRWVRPGKAAPGIQTSSFVEQYDLLQDLDRLCVAQALKRRALPQPPAARPCPSPPALTRNSRSALRRSQVLLINARVQSQQNKRATSPLSPTVKLHTSCGRFGRADLSVRAFIP